MSNRLTDTLNKAIRKVRDPDATPVVAVEGERLTDGDRPHCHSCGARLHELSVREDDDWICSFCGTTEEEM